MTKNQSAFSLIEVMVSLLILSIVVLGTSDVLLETTRSYQRAERREDALNMAWSIADVLRLHPNEEQLEVHTQHWQEKLDKIFPGSVLEISTTIEVVEVRAKLLCVYSVSIHFVEQDIAPLNLKVVV